MTVYELQAFGGWMVRKAVRLPLKLVKQVGIGLEFMAKAVYEDGGVGFMLCFLISCLGFMLGFIAGGIREEIIKPEDTIVHLSQVAHYGLVTGGITAVVIFFYTCWYCFKQEQEELFKNLKDGYDNSI